LPIDARGDLKLLARIVSPISYGTPNESVKAADVRDTLLPRLVSRQTRVPDNSDSGEGVESAGALQAAATES
jgi:hypothetical protein